MKSRSPKGFTLLELVIVLAVMAVLSGVLVPIVKQIMDSAKVTKITSLVDALTNACRRYYKDTRSFAKEYGYSSLVEEHQLAYDQTGAPSNLKDWNGPYIEGPLLDSILPFDGAQIQLLDTLNGIAPGNQGYHLAGASGPKTQNSKGQEIYLGPIPLKWAVKINEAFDGTTEAFPATEGRVVYFDMSGSCDVYIFVLDPYGTAK